ncbi:MFS transporter [Corynebacterium faecale]
MWLAAVLVYVVAITGRTSFGVAGIEAVERFQVDASRVAVFASVQLGVYALAQIPTGLVVDRFGARKTLLAGALLMAVGQVLLGLTTSYPVAIFARVLIGMGDATAFLSVMRLLPYWFPMRVTPIFSQISGALGQVGQFISAVPFLYLLNVSGWTTAFITLGSAGAIIALAAAVVVRDAPPAADGEAHAAPPSGDGGTSISIRRVGRNLKIVLTNAYAWQGLFTHWTNMMPVMVFLMLWGVPAMRLGLGLDDAQVGAVLTLYTVATVIGAPLCGLVSARLGLRRNVAGLGVAVVQICLWAVLFLPREPHEHAFVVVSVILVLSALISPVANYGFDTVREQLDRSVMVTGTGFANMGGFTASMLATQLLGFLLDVHADGGGYDWSDFRFAWTAVGIVWLLGAVGYLVCLRIVRRGAMSSDPERR